MAIEITDFIIHRIDKIQHEDPKVHLRKRTLPIDDPKVAKFTELAVEVFKSHEDRPSSIFADFNEDTDNYPFSEWCLKYFQDELNFIKFTGKATNRLSSRMSSQQASSGGFVVFAGFTENDVRKLFVVMLHPQEGLSITDSLEFTDVTHLDLKHIDKAALVTGPTNNTFASKPLAYAGFRKEMSRYFQEFIGPDAFRNPSKDSRKLIEAVEEYAHTNNFAPDQLDSIRINLRTYANGQIAANKELDLNVLSSLVHPESPNSFRLFAAEKGISGLIKPDQSVFNKWKLIRHKSADGLVLQFKAEQVGEPGTSHRLELDQDGRTLTIKDIEQELIDKVNATRI